MKWILYHMFGCQIYLPALWNVFYRLCTVHVSVYMRIHVWFLFAPFICWGIQLHSGISQCACWYPIAFSQARRVESNRLGNLVYACLYPVKYKLGCNYCSLLFIFINTSQSWKLSFYAAYVDWYFAIWILSKHHRELSFISYIARQRWILIICIIIICCSKPYNWVFHSDVDQ